VLALKIYRYNEAMTKYFTGTGDDGTTGLLGPGRSRKDSPRLEAVGTIDEANAALGVARASSMVNLTAEILLAVQRDLYHIMAEVAATKENAARFRTIGSEQIDWLASQINRLESQIEPTNDFVVPGDSSAGAYLDLARSIVRRAERRVTGLYFENEIENPHILGYLNRLSSLCFVLELIENRQTGKDEPTLAKG
jgi:cob(I)alamin adenosyltransferase